MSSPSGDGPDDGGRPLGHRCDSRGRWPSRRRALACVAAFACAALVAACSSDNIAATPPDSATTASSATTVESSGTNTETGNSAAPTGGSTDSEADKLPDGFGAGPPGDGLQQFYDQQIRWADCGGGDTCADFWVPLDYADPNGPAITLKAKRSPAADQAHKVGSLFINPGGPGVSGIDYLSFAGFDKAVTNVYDVIGFDPRGVGSSTPVNCLGDSTLDAFVASDPSPDTPREVAQLRRIWARYTAGCVADSGPLLQHVSTVEVARDLDVMRSVVGDRTLHYFGASYGTYIGAVYAALFPQFVGRMVLDGAVDPLASPHRTYIDQAVGFETALTAYLRDCVGTGTCPLGTDVDTARTKLIAFLTSLDSSPLPTSSGRQLTEGLGFLGVVVTLYSRSAWPTLSQALDAGLKGQGDVLLALADLYVHRRPDGTYAGNSIEVQSAVSCLDHPEHESLADIEAGAAEFDRVAPVFGPVATWYSYGCSNWPEPRIQPVPDFSAKGAAPIVVVGTTRDPATPYAQAVKLAEELDSGILLSRDGDGHTAYNSGNVCIDSAIDTYLADGTVPADGTRC